MSEPTPTPDPYFQSNRYIVSINHWVIGNSTYTLYITKSYHRPEVTIQVNIRKGMISNNKIQAVKGGDKDWICRSKWLLPKEVREYITENLNELLLLAEVMEKPVDENKE